jgi:hypothetical protein
MFAALLLLSILHLPVISSAYAEETWIKCAEEGSPCALPKPAVVRYGAGNVFALKKAAGIIPCTNDQFGDPLFGTRKNCWYLKDWPGTVLELCAWEGDYCSFEGTTEISYGLGGSVVQKTLTDGTWCTNRIFGDPIPGYRKQCTIKR